MRNSDAGPIISAMTNTAASAKLMLLEDRRGGSAGGGAAQVRRFKLARLRFDAAVEDPRDRFAYLKRSHD
jgi:hypothetical protein